jgi:4-hydroxybenzoate polyprenyltransferase
MSRRARSECEALPRHGPLAKLAAYLELLHPAPVALVLLAAAGFTAVAAQRVPPLAQVGPFLLSVLLTQSAISIHNDYCDRELDARSKPWRVLPQGLMAPGTALTWSVVLTVLGLLVAVPLGGWVVTLVAIATAAGFAYNAGLKRSAWSWLPFWLGLPTLPLAAFAVVDRFEPRLWSVYLIGAPLAVAVYLADTLSDIESDTTLGVRGLAHRLGPRPARFACWAMLGVAQALALVLWPAPHAPGTLYFLSGALLGAAILLGCYRVRRGHWLAIMASATALAVGWLADVAN